MEGLIFGILRYGKTSMIVYNQKIFDDGLITR